MIYADTSFIASAYGKDVNTAAARGYLLREEPTLPFGFLHWPELARFFVANPAGKGGKTLGFSE